MEDLRHGQRIGNYSIDFKRKGSIEWEVLVPSVQATNSSAHWKDRPDGNDPRDSHIGHKRIDVPIVPTSGQHALHVSQIRFNCLRLIDVVDVGAPVYLRKLSLHKKLVPWEMSSSAPLLDT